MTSNISFINASPKPEELSVNDLEYGVVYYVLVGLDDPVYYILITDGADDYLVNFMGMDVPLLMLDKVHYGVKFYKCKSVTISIDR